MGVAMHVVGVGGFRLWRGGAAVGGRAANDLKLNRSVRDVEALAQGAVDSVEDGG